MKTNLAKYLLLTLLLCSGCESNNSSQSSVESSSNSSSSSEVIIESSKVEEKKYWNETYANPVSVTTASGSNYNSEIADPSVVKGDNGYYYIVATNKVMLRSEDCCNWEVVTTNLINTPTWGQEITNSYGLWAPDLIKIGDKWIYYYSLSGWGSPVGIGYAYADDVEGPYTDGGKLFNLNEIGIKNCIDPQPFIDDDGAVYMTVGSFQGLYVVELTADGMGCMGGVEYQAENKTLIAGYPGNWDGATYEGGYIVKRNDYYYYFGSAGTCCAGVDSTYKVYVGRATEVTGPYYDTKGRKLTQSAGATTCGELVLWAGTVGTERDVVGVGHNSVLVDDSGEWWMYYHGYSSLDTFGTRHLFMDRIAWTDDGWPYVTYTYEDDNGEEKTVNYKPSFQIELDGPKIEE